MTVAEDRLARIEGGDLKGLGRADIDDGIEYVHVPTARLPEYLSLYDRYLRQRWNVNDLDFTEDVTDWTERMSDEGAARVTGNVIGRVVDADEIAYVVAFLASPKSVAITGDAIACGGGVRGAIYY